jgi:hypothetical protein
MIPNVIHAISPAGDQIIYKSGAAEVSCPRCSGIIVQGDQVRIDVRGALHCGARWVCDMRKMDEAGI